MSYDNRDYKTDIKYVMDDDGVLDVGLTDSGDISLIGGSSSESRSVRRENLYQQLSLRIITPFGVIRDQNGDPYQFGSEVHAMVGEKLNSINGLLLNSYVYSALASHPDVESVYGITAEKRTDGTLLITARIKIIGDEEELNLNVTAGV